MNAGIHVQTPLTNYRERKRPGKAVHETSRTFRLNHQLQGKASQATACRKRRMMKNTPCTRTFKEAESSSQTHQHPYAMPSVSSKTIKQPINAHNNQQPRTHKIQRQLYKKKTAQRTESFRLKPSKNSRNLSNSHQTSNHHHSCHTHIIAHNTYYVKLHGLMPVPVCS